MSTFDRQVGPSYARTGDRFKPIGRSELRLDRIAVDTRCEVFGEDVWIGRQPSLVVVCLESGNSFLNISEGSLVSRILEHQRHVPDGTSASGRPSTVPRR
jgi:hypothetical protein